MLSGTHRHGQHVKRRLAPGQRKVGASRVEHRTLGSECRGSEVRTQKDTPVPIENGFAR